MKDKIVLFDDNGDIKTFNTLKLCGEHLSLTGERVRQILLEDISKVKNIVSDNKYRKYIIKKESNVGTYTHIKHKSIINWQKNYTLVLNSKRFTSNKIYSLIKTKKFIVEYDCNIFENEKIKFKDYEVLK